MNAQATMWRVCADFLTCRFLLVIAGCDAVADSANSLPVTRSVWRNVVLDADVRFLEIELICSDTAMHRLRVEARKADIPGHKLPTWGCCTFHANLAISFERSMLINSLRNLRLRTSRKAAEPCCKRRCI